LYFVESYFRLCLKILKTLFAVKLADVLSFGRANLNRP
jgi:hypothetical protein